MNTSIVQIILYYKKRKFSKFDTGFTFSVDTSYQIVMNKLCEDAFDDGYLIRYDYNKNKKPTIIKFQITELGYQTYLFETQI